MIDVRRVKRGRAGARAPLAALVILAMVPWFSMASDAPHAERAAGASLDLATADASRWMVQLRTPPLASYRGGLPGFPATSPAVTGRRLDLSDHANGVYLAHLQAQQVQLASRLQTLIPTAQIQRSYRIVLNALAVKMSRADAARVRRLPGVEAVTPDLSARTQMFASPVQMGAPSLWNRLGGVRSAGEGVKVAIIDSGMYVTKNSRGGHTGNACFSGAGYRAPQGYPKGDARFTNNKVLVARVYIRPDDPAIDGDGLPVPGATGNSHGSHVAGTVGCNAGTRVNYLGTPLTLSGVAPRAFLMNYRVFYTSQSKEDFQSGNAYVVELVAAMEDAVADGADVVSSSWGSSYQNTRSWPDPMVRAAEAATDAGTVMVFAQGNSGPAEATGNAPSNSPKVIAVGAVTKNTAIAAGDVSVQGGPATLTGMPVGPASFGPKADAIGPASYVPAESVALNQSALGCSLEGDAAPFPPASMTGSIALIQRGTCAQSEKVFNAQRAGAIAAIVYNSVAGGDALQAVASGAHAGEVTIPSWFMRRSNALAMKEYRSTNSAATASFKRAARAVANVGDVLAGFSSYGPTAEQIIKPDVVAPGVDVLSAGYGGGALPGELLGFGAVSGTSMATPHVAGAAALLVQANRTWTPAQIKSALMSTANESIFGNAARSKRIGVLGRGAGAVNLARAATPGLTFDRPSLSAGNIPAGRAVTLRVTATDVGGIGGSWKVATSALSGLTIRPSTRLLTVGRRGSVTFDVTLSTATSVEHGAYEGAVVLTGPTSLHIPVYLRIVPANAVKDVLLVDDDGSSLDPSLLDVASGYSAALDGLGLSYDTVDVGADGFPALEKLFEYRLIVMFTGNNASFDTSGFSPTDQDVLAQWLDSGGRMLATGQNLGETTDSNGFASARIGRARLYHGYLGVLQEATDVFGSAVAPNPSGQGEGLMSGLTLDLSPGATGVPNQSSVEAFGVMFDNDSYQAPETVLPWFAPIGGNAPSGSKLAFGRSSEPSLESPLMKFGYRTAAFGFGLEGVGSSARAGILGRAARWLLDEVRVTITSVSAGASPRIRVSVASGAGASITRLRWSFGDGSRIVTGGPSMTHQYRAGSYLLRVEATDSLGHRSIASRRITIR